MRGTFRNGKLEGYRLPRPRHPFWYRATIVIENDISAMAAEVYRLSLGLSIHDGYGSEQAIWPTETDESRLAAVSRKIQEIMEKELTLIDISTGEPIIR